MSKWQDIRPLLYITHRCPCIMTLHFAATHARLHGGHVLARARRQCAMWTSCWRVRTRSARRRARRASTLPTTPPSKGAYIRRACACLGGKAVSGFTIIQRECCRLCRHHHHHHNHHHFLSGSGGSRSSSSRAQPPPRLPLCLRRRFPRELPETLRPRPGVVSPLQVRAPACLSPQGLEEGSAGP